MLGEQVKQWLPTWCWFLWSQMLLYVCGQDTQYILSTEGWLGFVKPGVCLTVKVAGLRSSGLEFKTLPCRWNRLSQTIRCCHPSKVGQMSTSWLVTGALYQRHSHISRKWFSQQPQAAYEETLVSGRSHCIRNWSFFSQSGNLGI